LYCWPESNRHGHYCPRDFHTTTAFAASFRCLGSGLSLNHIITDLGHSY